jgi:PBP1b-binding outer membrane lipoprotein LpoB
MLKRIGIILLLFFTSCYNNPAVSNTYDFKNVKSIKILPIKDFREISGSGEMIETSLVHNFLKYEFELKQNVDKVVLINESKNDILYLACLITQYKESDRVILPFRSEDRGYVETTINQSGEQGSDSEKLELISTSTTKTHSGNVVESSRIEYTQSKVSLVFNLRDMKSGKIVWSNSSWYNGLELQRTIDMCLKDNIYEIKKILYY